MHRLRACASPICPKDLFTLYPRNRRIELACKARRQGVHRALHLHGGLHHRAASASPSAPRGAIEWDGRTILIDHEKCIAYGPSCNEACVDICPSVILHRIGQSPRPELVEIGEPSGVS